MQRIPTNPRASGPPAISIVIPAYNAARFLAAIYAASYLQEWSGVGIARQLIYFDAPASRPAAARGNHNAQGRSVVAQRLLRSR